MADTKAEEEAMRAYMADKGLQAMFEGILVSLIKNQPDDVVGYTIDYLKKSRFQKELGKIAELKESHPDNLAMKHFDNGYFKGLSDDFQARLIEIVRSGFENADSGMGCYAMNPDDYDTFKPFMGKVIAGYHKVGEDAVHVNDWSLEGVEGLPGDGKLDLSVLGVGELSMRVRVGRNLSDFPLPGAMTADQRKALEDKMCGIFDKLIGMEEYGGTYSSLTPGHKDFVDETEYQRLVDAHIMFKDMDADPYLKSAGIASDWPQGRGCYCSADGGFIIWVGEEDHLRIMCMKKGSLLNDVFDRLKAVLDMIDTFEGLAFGKSPWAGYVTSCPTNLGTGMRASVHIPLPALTKDGSDVSEAKKIAKSLGLSVRGAGGEHTEAGAGGIVDISPSARFCIKEGEIIAALYKGIQQLYEAEKAATAGATPADDSPFAKELGLIAQVAESNPDNLAMKHFDLEYFNGLSDEMKARHVEIVRSGFENADSGMGCYAMNPDDYDTFKPFMGKVIAGYHKVGEDAVHVNDWSLEGVEGLPGDGKLDLSVLGVGELSMRVRVGRNLSDFPLPGAMTADQRKALEDKMCGIFDKLIGMEEYGGTYSSLTPGHKDFVDETEYQRLVDAHVMFKDMDADPYLKSAGIASDWPQGRGCYCSADGGFIIWVGEEDHLRIMCMKKGSLLNDVFDRLKAVLDMIDTFEGLAFGKSPWAGYVTSCPTNLGTGMRASVHIPLPALTKDGSDVSEAKKIAKSLGLSVRGAGGEHTEAGAGGIVDISPSARFCIKEGEIIAALYKGIQQLYEAEKAAA